MPNPIKKTIKFLFTADVHRLSIKKNINFMTKIIWKRNTNKAQTQLKKHENGVTVFNQKIQLQINLVWDEQKKMYEEKNTQISAVIQLEGKIKSGGTARYNISQIVNGNQKNKLQTIGLTQCPDPNAFVEITFDYTELTLNNLDASINTLNASIQDQNLSRIDFNDDKLSLEINRIKLTVNKLDDLAFRVKNKQNLNSQHLPKLKSSIQILESQKLALKSQLQNLETSKSKIQQKHQQQKQQILKQVSELQKKVEKQQKQIQQNKNQAHKEQYKKQIKCRNNIETSDQNKMIDQSGNSEKKYKKLYECALQQIEELKSINMMKNQLNFKADLGDVDEIAHFQNSDDEGDKKNKSKNSQKPIQKLFAIDSKEDLSQSDLLIQELKKKNQELQQTVAAMSYKLATLFNASFQFGGAHLLDYLQTSIGLTEKN